jgi:hypothetical protein
MEVADSTTTFVAATPPIVTDAPAAKFAPPIRTAVPPAADPELGLMDETAGEAGDGPMGGSPPHDASAAASTTIPKVRRAVIT